jgi:hypothetical protein
MLMAYNVMYARTRAQPKSRAAQKDEAASRPGALQRASPAPVSTRASVPVPTESALRKQRRALAAYDRRRRVEAKALYLSDACVLLHQQLLAATLLHTPSTRNLLTLMSLLDAQRTADAHGTTRLATRLLLVQPDPHVVAAAAAVPIDEKVVMGPITATTAALLENQRTCLSASRVDILGVHRPDDEALFATPNATDVDLWTQKQWNDARLNRATETAYGADVADLPPGAFRFIAPPRRFITTVRQVDEPVLHIKHDGALVEGGVMNVNVVQELAEAPRRTLHYTISGAHPIRVEAVERARVVLNRRSAAGDEGDFDTKGEKEITAIALRRGAIRPAGSPREPAASFDVAVLCPLPTRRTASDDPDSTRHRGQSETYTEYLTREMIRAGDRTHGRLILCLHTRDSAQSSSDAAATPVNQRPAGSREASLETLMPSVRVAVREFLAVEFAARGVAAVDPKLGDGPNHTLRRFVNVNSMCDGPADCLALHAFWAMETGTSFSSTTMKQRADMFPGMLAFDSVLVPAPDITADLKAFNTGRDSRTPNRHRYEAIQAATEWPSNIGYRNPSAAAETSSMSADVSPSAMFSTLQRIKQVPFLQRADRASFTYHQARLNAPIDSLPTRHLPRELYRFYSLADHIAEAYAAGRISQDNPLGVRGDMHSLKDPLSEPVVVHSAANAMTDAILRGNVFVGHIPEPVTKWLLRTAVVAPAKKRKARPVARSLLTAAALVLARDALPATDTHMIKDPDLISADSQAFVPGIDKDHSAMTEQAAKLARVKGEGAAGKAWSDKKAAMFDLNNGADRLAYHPTYHRHAVVVEKHPADQRQPNSDNVPPETEERIFDAQLPFGNLRDPPPPPLAYDDADANGDHGQPATPSPKEVGNFHRRRTTGRRVTESFQQLGHSMCNAAQHVTLRRCQNCMNVKMRWRVEHPTLLGIEALPFDHNTQAAAALDEFERRGLIAWQAGGGGGGGGGLYDHMPAPDRRGGPEPPGGDAQYSGVRGDYVLRRGEHVGVFSPYCDALRHGRSLVAESRPAATLLALSAWLPLVFQPPDDSTSYSHASLITAPLAAQHVFSHDSVPSQFSYFLSFDPSDADDTGDAARRASGLSNKASWSGRRTGRPATQMDDGEALVDALRLARDRWTDGQLLRLDALWDILRGQRTTPSMPTLTTAASLEHIVHLAVGSVLAPRDPLGEGYAGGGGFTVGDKRQRSAWITLGACLPSVVPSLLAASATGGSEAGESSAVRFLAAVQAEDRGRRPAVPAAAKFTLVNDADCAEVDDVVTQYTDGASIMPKLRRPRFHWALRASDSDAHERHFWQEAEDLAGRFKSRSRQGGDSGIATDRTRISLPFVQPSAVMGGMDPDGDPTQHEHALPTRLSAREVRTAPRGRGSVLIVDVFHFLTVYADARAAMEADLGAWSDPMTDWPSGPASSFAGSVGAVMGMDPLIPNQHERGDSATGKRYGLLEWHWAFYDTVVVLGTPPSGTSDDGDEESDGTRPVSSGEPPMDVLAELLAAARAAKRDGDAQAGRFEDVLARRHDEFLGRYGQRAVDEALTLYAAAMARAVLAARHYGEVRSWPGAATGAGTTVFFKRTYS